MAARSARARGRWWQLERRELTWLFVGLGLCVLLLGFVTLAGEVTEGDTQAFDTRILRALRDPNDLVQADWAGLDRGAAASI